MAISGIGNGMPNLSQLSQVGSRSQVAGAGKDGDGDNDGSSPGRVSRKGEFAAAISQALSQLGVTGASSTNSTAATQDPKQAIGAFMHDLFSALKSQGSGADSQDGGVAGVSGASGQKYGANNIESQLQSLIQQLSSSSSGSSGSSSSNSASAPLQQDFQNMLSALGASGSQVTLGSFLQSLSQNLQGANPVGNIVSTQA